MNEAIILDTEDKDVIIGTTEIMADNVLATVQAHKLKLLLGDPGGYTANELKLLDSLSTTALAQKRIISDDLNSAADRDVAAALARNIGRNHNDPFANSSAVVNKEFIQPNIPDIEIVPDETSQELSTLEYVE